MTIAEEEKLSTGLAEQFVFFVVVSFIQTCQENYTSNVHCKQKRDQKRERRKKESSLYGGILTLFLATSRETG